MLKSIKIVALIFSISFLFISCSHKLVFSTSAIVPAAEGTVKIKHDKNNNYTLDVEVTNLADPSKLQPSKENYVVWMNTERNGVKNIGQLKSSSGFFSDTRKASLSTVTPFKPVDIFITAENAVNIQNPQGMVVLRTK